VNKNLIASIIFAIGIVMFFILVLPQYNMVSFAKADLNAKQALFNERTAELNIFKNLNNDANLRQADIGRVIEFLPPSKRVDELVSSIQKVAGDSGMQLTNMTTSEVTATEETAYQTISIGLELVSQYPSFVTFLKSLEQNLRLYDIFEIGAGIATGGAPGAVNFSMKMNAYYLK